MTRRSLLLISGALLLVVLAIVLPRYGGEVSQPQQDPPSAPSRSAVSLTPAVEARLRQDFPKAPKLPSQVIPPANAEDRLAKSRQQLEEARKTLPPESKTRQAIDDCLAELDPLLEELKSKPTQDLSDRAYAAVKRCKEGSEQRVAELKAKAASGDDKAAKELTEEEKLLHFMADFCYVVGGVLTFTPLIAVAPLWMFAGALIDGISCVFYPDSCRPEGLFSKGSDNGGGGDPGDSGNDGWVKNAPQSPGGKAAMDEVGSDEKLRVIASQNQTGDFFLVLERASGALIVHEGKQERFRITPAEVQGPSGVDVKQAFADANALIGIRNPSGDPVVRFRTSTAEYALVRSSGKWVLQPWAEYMPQPSR